MRVFFSAKICLFVTSYAASAYIFCKQSLHESTTEEIIVPDDDETGGFRTHDFYSTEPHQLQAQV